MFYHRTYTLFNSNIRIFPRCTVQAPITEVKAPLKLSKGDSLGRTENKLQEEIPADVEQMFG